ncbi:MAG: glutamate 5-kinase, partial [Clostridia bacterium]|nr:glutamate 5-kinase [Clostridia bacterium]
MGVLPVINENDTVSTAEFGIGDNDTLAAVVAANAKADLLVLLSDIDGLYTADPRSDKSAKLIPVVDEITDEIEKTAGGSASALGTGGMATKIRGAKTAGASGCDTVIANGADPAVLYDIFEGKEIGTRFRAKK